MIKIIHPNGSKIKRVGSSSRQGWGKNGNPGPGTYQSKSTLVY